jgi:surface antigen
MRLWLAVLPLLAAAAAHAAEGPSFAARWGALAIDDSGRRAAVAYSNASQAEADAKAVEICGGGCAVKSRFADGQCLRAERADDGTLVADIAAADLPNPQGRVKELCKARFGNCRFAYAGCSSPAGVKARLLKLPARLEPGATSAAGFESVRAGLSGGAEVARQRAISTALERQRSGEPLAWSLPGGEASGSITPEVVRETGSAPCRPFRETLNVQGKSVSRSAEACRQPNGSWR